MGEFARHDPVNGDHISQVQAPLHHHPAKT